MKRYYILTPFMLISLSVFSQKDPAKTTFKFGGYIKADAINTWYQNGDVGENSPLRDFHLSGLIPVGDVDQNVDLDFHVKETRFNFDVKTSILGKTVHSFIEMDFMLSAAGNTKVSNSYNPRIRHAYFEWNNFLIGQTWSTFMLVVVPDEIDFTGAIDGLVFTRQPQIRYKYKNWWFSLENPETTIYQYNDNKAELTNSEIAPDVVVRKNFSGKWGSWSVAGIGRTLYKKDSLSRYTIGYGLTTGGRLIIGNRGDDIKIVATYGNGLGRYISAGFVSGAAMDSLGELNPINTLNGYVAYNHYWKPAKISSSFSVAAYNAFHDSDIVSQQINKMSYSVSANLKWNPIPPIQLGVEYMYAYRELEDNTNGAFHRIQVGAKYVFGYNNTVADEKR